MIRFALLTKEERRQLFEKPRTKEQIEALRRADRTALGLLAEVLSEQTDDHEYEFEGDNCS